MANVKISALPTATAAIGVDVVPLVQSGVTKKASVQVLLASPSASSWVGFTPTGDVSASTVQAAIAEIDSEKVAFSRLDDNDGSSLVGFLQSGAGAQPRSVQSKLRDVVSVKDFGAVGDGVADDTAAFSAAAITAPAVNTFVTHGISRALTATVFVPDGTYNLASFVDTAGKDIIYSLSNGAAIINPDNLNGRLTRDGRAYRAPGQTRFGSEDQATGFSVTTGKGGNEGAEVNGFTSYAQVSQYADRDSTTFFAENVGPAPLATVTNCTFTTTSVALGTALNATQIKQLRVGMFVDTNHSPYKYTGWISGWAANGTSISVEGWYLVDGVLNPASTPSSPATIYVNPVTKIWSVNANATLDANSHAEVMAVCEFGIVDNKAASTLPRGGSHFSWGVDSVNLGTYKAQAMFIARGETPGAFCGYRADGVDAGLFVFNTNKTQFVAQANSGPANNLTIRVNGEYKINNDRSTGPSP